MLPDEDIFRVRRQGGQLPELVVGGNVLVTDSDTDAKGSICQVFLHDGLVVFSLTRRGIFTVKGCTHASYLLIAVADIGECQDEYKQRKDGNNRNGYLDRLGKKYIGNDTCKETEDGCSPVGAVACFSVMI